MRRDSTEGELDDPIIQQRRTHLQRHSHTGAVHFHQDVVRQIRLEIEQRHLQHGIRHGWPASAPFALRELQIVAEIGNDRLTQKLAPQLRLEHRGRGDLVVTEISRLRSNEVAPADPHRQRAG